MGCCWLHSLVPHTSFTTEEESWQENPALLHGATRGYELYHVNVGSEPESGLNTSAFMCGFICVCACAVCVHVCVPSLMQNARGTPNHPVFHVLFLPYSFFVPFLSSASPSLFLSFCHLASVNRPLTEALRQLSHPGLCGVNGAHFIPPNLTAKTSVTALPINSWRQAINSCRFRIVFYE